MLSVATLNAANECWAQADMQAMFGDVVQYLVKSEVTR